MYVSICLCVFYSPDIGAMAMIFPVIHWKIFGDPLEFGASIFGQSQLSILTLMCICTYPYP